MDITNRQNTDKDLKEQFLEKIVKDPACEENYLELGKLYILEKNYEEALGVYESLLKVNSANVQALINAGSIHFYLQNIDKSIDYYTRASEQETSFTIYLNLGNAYAELGNFDEAMKNYSKALKLEPKNAALFNAIALLYQDKKDYVSANVFYDKAIAIEQNPETYLSKATVMMAMHVYKEAVNLLLKAISLDKTFVKAYICLANCYSSMKDFNNANKYFEICYEIMPSFYQAYVCHGISYSDERKIDKAIEKYQQAIGVNPNMPNAYILLGNIYVEQQKYKEAIQLYEKAVSIQPNDAKTYTFIGNTYYMLGDLEQAIYTYRKALKADNQSQENKLVYLEIIQEYIKRKSA